MIHKRQCHNVIITSGWSTNDNVIMTYIVKGCQGQGEGSFNCLVWVVDVVGGLPGLVWLLLRLGCLMGTSPHPPASATPPPPPPPPPTPRWGTPRWGSPPTAGRRSQCTGRPRRSWGRETLTARGDDVWCLSWCHDVMMSWLVKCYNFKNRTSVNSELKPGWVKNQLQNIFGTWQPDNRLAMKLFGSKKAFIRDRVRQQRGIVQQASRPWIIHPMSSFRW